MKSALRLKVNDQSSNLRIKRIAWAFLLPVGGGVTGDDPEHSNVGLLPEWTKSSMSRDVGMRVRRRKSEEASESDTLKGPENEAAESEGNHDLRVALQMHAFQADGLVESLQRKSLGWPPFTKTLATKDDPAFPHSIPEVYMQWRKRKLIEISTAMKVSLGPSPMHVDVATVPTLGTASLQSDRNASVGSPEHPTSGVRKKHQYVRNINQDMKISISRRSRTESESCRIPDTLLHKLDVGPNGAMSLAFSHCGIFLAVSGESKPPVPDSKGIALEESLGEIHSIYSNFYLIYFEEKIYSLHIFDSDTAELVWLDPRAHHGIVYQIRWSLNDCYLITSSADGTVKLWDTAGIINSVLHATYRPNFYMVSAQYVEC